MRRAVIQVPFYWLDGKKQVVELRRREGKVQVRAWPSATGEWIDANEGEVTYGPMPKTKRARKKAGR